MAIDEYGKARKMAEKAIHMAVVSGQYPYIHALDEYLTKNSGMSSKQIGTIDIPLEMVVGTKNEGRRSMFACNFMPAAEPDTEFALKWSAFYKSQSEEGMRDPISVFEYKHRFYVQEGNKRVSVMKYLDALTIRAEVTRIMPEEEDALYSEFLQFFELTKMYDFDFSEPGSYKKLIRLYGQSSDVPWDEMAVRRLYSVYYTFKNAYRKKYEEEQYCSSSDAFLKYLSVYGIESLRTASAEKLQQNLLRLHSEFLKEEKTEILETPEEEKSDLIDLSGLKKIIPFIPEKPLRIGLIYDSNPGVSSSVYEQELGRILLENRFGSKISTKAYENCSDEASLRAALTAATKDSDLIITTSPLHFTETFRFAIRQTGKNYLNRSLHLKETAVRTYDVRMYEAKFLLGALAAIFAENHKLAYIADVPVNGAVANINAFAIGAAIIDPKAEVYLGWKSTLDQDWQEQMKRLDIRVFSGDELPDFSVNTLEYGIYKLTESGPVNLAVPVINWANYYGRIIQSILDGTYGSRKDKAVSYWWGMSADVLDVNVSGSLPYASRKLIRLLKQGLTAGKLNPFDGELHSTKGQVKGPFDPVLSNAEIITMNWLNDNIIGIIPEYAQLNDSGRVLSDVSGGIK